MLKGRYTVSREDGFAAIIIAIVLVIVLSLITVGFAALMRKEQRAALDRQLSNAAYYAAESGVNDAAAAVRAGFTTSKTQCGPYTAAQVATLPSSENQAAATKYLMNAGVDNGSNTSYSCLIISPNPSTLEYSSVEPNEATTAVLTGSDASGTDTVVNTLIFSWQDANSGKTFGPYNNSGVIGCPAYNASNPFPSVPCWKNNGSAITGILRVNLTPVSGNFSRRSLELSNYTAFLYPRAGSQTTIPNGTYTGAAPASVPYGSYAGHAGTNSGDIVYGACNLNSTPRYCAAAVTGLNQTTYLLHLSSVYASTQVTVTPYNCVGSTCTRIYLKGAQTLIDSTGKAQDVLRRIQVRLPARNSYDYPEFGLATGGPICKLLTSYPPNLATGNPGNTINSCETGTTPSGL